MINHISIKNFAIIEHTEIDFENGLNIITGETGAGKSIVIEAVSLALGSRADSSYVRTGKDKAIIQLAGILDGEEVVITREISATGKNLCRLNGEIVTLAQLNQVAHKLADIHGQYDNQSLLNPDNHILFVDAYRHDISAPLQDEVRSAFEKYSQARHKLGKLLTDERENRKKMDFYRFEAGEIEKACLQAGEDKELEDRISMLQNSEKIYENVEGTYTQLYEASPSTMEVLHGSLRALEEISAYSSEIRDIAQEFNDIYYRLEDVCRDLRSMKDSLSFDPAELDEAISRLEVINGLKKKYGSTIEEILEYYDKISQELSLMENYDEAKAEYEKELKLSYAALVASCKKLTDARKESALHLEEKILAELKDLNFGEAKIEIAVLPLEKPCETGMDHVEIRISTNKGEALKPLNRVASGGEMSRIMLAFKNIISSYDNIDTLIFDEIDAGISGITASIVGKKLREISKQHQIICITHLPQIAACGDYNYRIYKESDENSTFTRVEPLTADEKINEIARLLGGTNITETTLESSRELIKNCTV